VKDLERRTNEKGKEFLNGLMDEKREVGTGLRQGWQALWVHDK
jgi:hypothetical protein